jgi:hypothetical protein
VDFTAVRIALTIACQEGMAFHRLDVKCALLYGYLVEEIYMRLPQEYKIPDGSVCRIKRSICGLKQAPRAWNARLTDELKSLGYQPFLHAERIFWREKESIKVFHVDDFLLIRSTTVESNILKIKSDLGKLNKIKDPVRAEYFLGINLEYSAGFIKLGD